MASALKITTNNIKNDYRVGELVTGEITLIPNVDIDFKEFGFRLILESRGKVGTSERIIKTERILTKTLLFRNKTYKYPINIINNQFETYQGINASFIMKLETYGVLSDKELNRSLKPMINPFNLIDPNKQWIKSKYIKYSYDNYEYSIKENFIELKNSQLNKKSIFVFFISVFAIIFLSTSKDFSQFAIVPFIVMVSFGLYILSSYILIGSFRVKLHQKNAEEFETTCYSDKNWNLIKSANVSFLIKEEVIDKRGTSEQKLTETRYKSQAVKHHKVKNDLISKHLFPKNKPASITIVDSKIYWNIELELISFFYLKYHFNEVFTVKKIIKEE